MKTYFQFLLIVCSLGQYIELTRIPSYNPPPHIRVYGAMDYDSITNSLYTFGGIESTAISYNDI